MYVQFLGSGDAFGSGGRYQTCIYVNGGNVHFLIDCGASSLIALKKFGINPLLIDYIFLTHLHGDHFGGIIFMLRELQLVAKRSKPLVIAGPPGTENRINDASEILFPGSTRINLGFPLKFVELPEETPCEIDSVTVTAFGAVHTHGTEPHSLRVEYLNRVIAYTGDTEWNENIPRVAKGANLFICECYFYEKTIKNHLSYSTLIKHRDEIDCERLVITHMSDDMLNKLQTVDIEFATDGKKIAL